MRVYKMYHMFHDRGLTATNAGNIIEEIKEDISENGEDKEHDYTKEKLPVLKKSIESLPIEGDINNATAVVHFGPFIIKATEMTKEEYDNLPEFDGY